jgi:hypothetical protein
VSFVAFHFVVLLTQVQIKPFVLDGLCLSPIPGGNPVNLPYSLLDNAWQIGSDGSDKHLE